MSAAKKTGKKGEKGASKTSTPPSYRLPRDGSWGNAWKLSAALGVVGAIGCAIGASSDPHRFAFSWLFGLMTFLAIGLGALFFVLALHLTGAGWGGSVRRIAEFFMAGLPVLGLCAIPVFFQMDELYPWMEYWHEAQEEAREGAGEGEGETEGEEHSAAEGLIGASIARAQDHAGAGRQAGGHGGREAREGGAHGAHHTPQHAAHEEVVRSKLAYLDMERFIGRGILYILVWCGLAFFFFRASTLQDTSKELGLSRRMESFAPISTFAFALTLTFAAFDWLMSLEPTWFSTIFGVQYFAVSCVSSLAVLILAMHALRSSGVTGEAIKVDHFHDVGKLLFGFNVFWAYISFSQFMLIWYASIPEETTYYHLRGTGGWWTYTLALLIIHFFIPFFLLLSRNVKRRVPILAFGAGWMLFAHVFEVFWLVMPYAGVPGELSAHWLDLAALFAVGGIYLTAVFVMMGRYPLIPIGDPRLSRSLHLEVA